MPIPGPRCPECSAPLVIHQPDTGLPDRLLGTCGSCLTWCLIDGDLRVAAVLPTHGRVARPARRRWRIRGLRAFED